MSDIQYWDDTLSEELEQLQALLDRIPKLSSHVERASAIERAKARVRSANGTKRSFKMETRLLQDVAVRRQYEARLSELANQLQTCAADVKALEREQERGELFVDKYDDEDAAEQGLNGQQAGDRLLKEAGQLQDKTQDSLSNTKNMIASSKEVGMATLEELERQRGVLENIEKEADRVDDNLARAEALLKHFGKRMASDHFIQCFAFINCMLLFGVVLYAILKGGGLPGTDDSKPNNPVQSSGA